jgi:hypothetical protein
VNVSYRINIDDPSQGSTRRFVKRGMWPFPFAPRVGDHVKPHESVPVAAEVKAVMLAPEENRILLDFRADGLRGDVREQIEALVDLGFIEVSPGDEDIVEP